MSIRTTHSAAPVLSWCTRVNISTEVSLLLFFCLCYFFTFDFNLDLFLFSSCRTHFHSSVKLLLCCVDHLLSFTVWGSTRLCSYPLFNAVKTKDEPSCFTVAAHLFKLRRRVPASVTRPEPAQTCLCVQPQNTTIKRLHVFIYVREKLWDSSCFTFQDVIYRIPGWYLRVCPPPNPPHLSLSLSLYGLHYSCILQLTHLLQRGGRTFYNM